MTTQSKGFRWQKRSTQEMHKYCSICGMRISAIANPDNTRSWEVASEKLNTRLVEHEIICKGSKS